MHDDFDDVYNITYNGNWGDRYMETCLGVGDFRENDKWDSTPIKTSCGWKGDKTVFIKNYTTKELLAEVDDRLTK